MAAEQSDGPDDSSARDFAVKVAASFDVVCFDLDQCAVAAHSRGSLLRANLDEFAAKISADFVLAVPALLERNVKLAIATHSDLAQHSDAKPRRGDDAIVLGDELVHEVLWRVIPAYAHEFFVVAWRPKSRGSEGDSDPGKIRHVRACAAFYGVPPERCVLFDDDPTNCNLTSLGNGSRFSAYRSDPEKGFRFSDFVCDKNGNDKDDYFVQNPDGTIDRLDRWEGKWNTEYDRKPRFHLPVVNPILVKFHGTEFHPPKDLPILLPLCGKSMDLQWLSEQGGHQWVVGVEGVLRAIHELQDELLPNLKEINRNTPDDASKNNDFDVYTTATRGNEWFPPQCVSNAQNEGKSLDSTTISIVRADFFGLSPQCFSNAHSPRVDIPPPRFGAVFDRAAIVAVPPHSRPEYVDVIDSLLIPGGQILMITVDSGRKNGPPFPVTPGVVEELFSTRNYTTLLLEERDADFGEGSKEYIFLLTKPL